MKSKIKKAKFIKKNGFTKTKSIFIKYFNILIKVNIQYLHQKSSDEIKYIGEIKMKNELLKSVLEKVEYTKITPKDKDDFKLKLFPKIQA